MVVGVTCGKQQHQGEGLPQPAAGAAGCCCCFRALPRGLLAATLVEHLAEGEAALAVLPRPAERPRKGLQEPQDGSPRGGIASIVLYSECGRHSTRNSAARGAL